MDLKNARGTAPILKTCKVVRLRICREAGQAMTSRPVVYITVCILWTNADVIHLALSEPRAVRVCTCYVVKGAKGKMRMVRPRTGREFNLYLRLARQRTVSVQDFL